MRWVDRGPEPCGVAGYAQQFTQGWVNHFQHRILGRPDDSHWREFRSTMGNRTNNICWYCERVCDARAESGGRAPTVDHFRPLRHFPQLAYEWSNWVFSCHACNVDNKADRWPDSGFIDPCASVVAERPEHYLDYNVNTAEIQPQDGLSEVDRRKAEQTIDSLGLNRLDVQFYRSRWTLKFRYDILRLPVSERQAFIDFMTAEVPYAGTTQIVVEQLRQDGHI